jgi:hypothetical protein
MYQIMHYQDQWSFHLIIKLPKKINNKILHYMNTKNKNKNKINKNFYHKDNCIMILNIISNIFKNNQLFKRKGKNLLKIKK